MAPRSAVELEETLSEPSPQLVEFARTIGDPVTVLGAGGKMGPSLVLLLQRAVRRAGSGQRVLAISTFSNQEAMKRLDAAGVETVRADLTEKGNLDALPDAEDVIDLVGQKFGTVGNEPETWAINAYAAGKVAERYRTSRIVFYSTGNVYPLVPVAGGGAKEGDLPGPVGEYAQSRLGGERILEYFSRRWATRVTIIRLNYAVELRYGVLHDVAKMVMEHRPIDLRMGHVNVIWQRDANEIGIRALKLASSPPFNLNVTGTEVVSVRRLAGRFGELLGVKPVFIGKEEDTALLSDASLAASLFDFPRTEVWTVVEWVAEWLKGGGGSLNKPTHFQEREGAF